MCMLFSLFDQCPATNHFSDNIYLGNFFFWKKGFFKEKIKSNKYSFNPISRVINFASKSIINEYSLLRSQCIRISVYLTNRNSIPLTLILCFAIVAHPFYSTFHSNQYCTFCILFRFFFFFFLFFFENETKQMTMTLWSAIIFFVWNGYVHLISNHIWNCFYGTAFRSIGACIECTWMQLNCWLSPEMP